MPAALDAREHEAIELLAMRDICAAAPSGGSGAVARAVGSATVFAMPGTSSLLFNRVLGMGVDAPAEPEEIDAVIDVASSVADRWVVALAPHARPGYLWERLMARGFLPGYPWMKFRRGVEPPPMVATDLDVSPAATPDLGAAFSAVVREVYDLPEATDPPVSALCGRPGWACFLARAGREPVATMALFSRDRVGWLGFAATRPAFRNRGAQGALMAACIRHAARLGLRHLVAETGERRPGMPEASYRNILRMGFREAYLRPNLVSPAPPGSAAPMAPAVRSGSARG